MKKIMIITIALLLLTGLAEAVDPNSIISRYVNASGGWDQIQKVKSISFESSIKAWEIEVAVAQDTNGAFRISEPEQLSGFDGVSEYWAEYHGMVSTMGPDQIKELQGYSFLNFFFHNLLKPDGTPVSLEYLEKSEKHGVQYHILKQQSDDDTIKTYFFNHETGLLEKIIERTSHPEMGDLEQMSRIADYQKVGELLLFGSIEISNISDGQTSQPRTEIMNIQINPEFDNGFFNKPESKRQPARIKNNKIEAEIINVSRRGGIVVNVTRETIDMLANKTGMFSVKIHKMEKPYKYYTDIQRAVVEQGEYILFFNNTPALWLVKAYENLTHEMGVKVGDIVTLTPLEETENTKTGASHTPSNSPETGVSLPEENKQPEKRSPAPLPSATRIMNYREFGNTGLKVSDISIGAGSLSDPLVVDYALDLGINYFDTAESYGRGASETAIGQVAARRREEMIICTKLVMHKNTKKQEIINRFQNSLARLQTTYADVLMIHGGDPGAIENPAVYEAFEQLKSEKKLRFSGVSSHGPEMTQALWPVVKDRKVDVILLSYDPVTYPDLPDLLKAAEDQGIGLVAMKVFSSARAAHLEEFESGEYPYNIASLRWVLRDPYIDTCIPSASFVDHIDQYVRVSGYPGNTDNTNSVNQTSSKLPGKPLNALNQQAVDLLTGIDKKMSPVGDVMILQQDELWKHINGADQQYINFGCETLTVAYYQDPTEKYEISIELYQMSDSNCGFGVYTSQKPPEVTTINLGTEGYGKESNLSFYQGRFYVQMSSDKTSEKAWKQLNTIATIIADNIDAEKSIPTEFSVFPTKEFPASTYAYHHRGILGISGLNQAFSAITTNSGAPVTIYLLKATNSNNGETHEQIFKAGYTKTGDRPLRDIKVGQWSGLMGSLKYKGPVLLFRTEEFTIFVTGTEDMELIESLLRKILPE